MREYLLPESGRFYKVNMHCHTKISDGAQTPEEIKKFFTEKGYSAVAFTDHEMMLDHSYLSDDNFIALTAYEYGFDKSQSNPLSGLYEGKLKTGEHSEKVHLNLYSKDPHDIRMVCCNYSYIWGNAKKYLDVCRCDGDGLYERKYSLEGVNEVIRAARDRGMLVIYNHPNWSMNKSDFYCKLEGLTGMEILNGDGGADSDMEDNPFVYQEMARAGKRIICVGGDDNHSEGACGLCWTMVKAESLSYSSLIDGLEKGNCYASSGPEITELYIEDGALSVKTSDAVGIYLHTAGRRADRVLQRELGRPVNGTQFRLRPEDVMFRISVRDGAGNHAYTRYYYLDELKKPIV